MAIDWRDWSPAAFREAKERGCRVLLFLHAAWCRWCRELEEDVLADPRVAGLVAEHFVALKVEKDRRPDIDARYAKGGWPTIAYLDADGGLLAADNWLSADELARRLASLVEAPGAASGQAPPAAHAADEPKQARAFPEPELVDWVARTVLETADPEYGGWGLEHKFPHPEAIDFALLRWSQTGDAAMRHVVLRTLRHMQQGQIHDHVEGGFYRYATQRDWSRPHSEKMLDSNAARLYAYLEAHQALGDPSFRETAQGILGWLEATLYDPATGAYRGSQDADPAYANLATRAARAQHGAPACDPTIFANWNAQAAAALFKAGAVLDDPRWSERALGVLEFICTELFDEREGVYHYWDGTYHLAGLLSDQAYVLRALLDAAQYAGHNGYLATARRIADLSIERLRSPSGAFYDKPWDPAARGSLQRRDRSLLENAVMAEALLRLSYRTHDEDYRECAVRALASFAADYKRFGHFVAGYGRAVDLLLHPPVLVTIVGPAGAPATQALVRAALGPYVASRVVQQLDPERDGALLAASCLPSAEPDGEPGARAYVHSPRGSWAETADPLRLPALMSRIERG